MRCTRPIETVWVLVAWLPILWLLSVSIQPDEALFSGNLPIIPKHPTLGAYGRILSGEGHVLRALVNSLAVSGMTAAIGLVMGAAVALYFIVAGRTTVFSRNLGVALVASRFLPSAAVVPGVYWSCLQTNLLDSVIGLVLSQVVSTAALSMLLLAPAFAALRRSHIDQALLEGAGAWIVWRRLIWPQVGGVVGLIFLVCFALSWNEFFLSNMISETPRSQTLSVLVATGVGQFRVQYSFLAAGGVLTLVPAVVAVTYLLTRAGAMPLSRTRPTDQ